MVRHRALEFEFCAGPVRESIRYLPIQRRRQQSATLSGRGWTAQDMSEIVLALPSEESEW